MEIYTSALQRENDRLVILKDTLYPWGVLHNDHPFEYKGFRTLTHYIYAQLVDEEEARMDIQTLTHPNDVRMYFVEWISGRMNGIQERALMEAYTLLYDTKPSFRKQLATSNLLVTQVPTELFRRNTLVLNQLRKKYDLCSRSPAQTHVYGEDSPFSPFTSQPFTLKGYTFENVAQYVYFHIFTSFLKDEEQAYETVRLNPHKLIQLFTYMLEKEHDTKVKDVCEESLPYKFENPFFRRVLQSTPSLFDIRENGTAARWIGFHTVRVLDGLKRNLMTTYPPPRIVDYRSFLKDPFLKTWIFEHRLPDFLSNATSIVETFGSRFVSKEALLDVFALMTDHLYGCCDFDFRNVFVFDPPLEFYEHVLSQSNVPFVLDAPTLYFLWSYVTYLFQMVDTQYAETQNPPPVFLQEFRTPIPSSLGKGHMYLAVRTILYCLQSIHLKLFSVFEINDRVLQCILQILRCDVEMYGGGVSRFKTDTLFYKQIYTDLMDNKFHIPKNQFRQSVMDIYLLVEVIAGTPQTQSRIHSFS